MFAERLDFIMQLTGTKASALGRASLVDASHVSRLRSGSRALPKKPAFLPAMSAYLAKRICADYQKSSMCEALRLPSWPVNGEQAAALIETWLLGEAERAADVEPILARFTDRSLPGAAPDGGTHRLPRAKRFYYGPEGKREAVLQFFSAIRKETSPQTLLLSSEEEMGWLYEDPAFAARWAAEFTGLLRAGNRVKIIHNIGRDLNELIEAVAKWVPVYMTGMIEPYYYPKLRDGITQRTLFLAPKSAAVVSTSVVRKADGMLNELITDPAAVAALTLEYETYFSLCRPLMRILTARDADELWRVWGALAAADGDAMCASGMPTLATMPEPVAAAMQARAPKSRLLELRNASAAALTKLLQSSRYTELLPESFADAAALNLPCADAMGAPGLCYTRRELLAHCAHARALADAHPNYEIIPQNGIPPQLLLYAKEGRGVMMANSDAPGVAFAISETSLTNAFWDYLSARLG